MKKVVVPALGVLTIAGLCLIAYYFYSDVKSAENKELTQSAVESDSEAIGHIAPVVEIESQPSGYGESIKLSESEVSAYRQGVGSIDFGDVTIPSRKLKNYTDMEGVVAGALTKEKDGRYTCNISWSKGISQTDYDALCIIAGQIYESELNKNESNRYEVTTSRPNGNAMQEVGIPVYWDIDENFFLTVWTTCEIVDFKEETKTTTLEPFTLYYELNYLNLK